MPPRHKKDTAAIGAKVEAAFFDPSNVFSFAKKHYLKV